MYSAGAASDFSFSEAAAVVADSEVSEVSEVSAVEAAEAAFQVEEVPSEEEELDAVFRIYGYGAVRCLKILTVRITANILKY